MTRISASRWLGLRSQTHAPGSIRWRVAMCPLSPCCTIGHYHKWREIQTKTANNDNDAPNSNPSSKDHVRFDTKTQYRVQYVTFVKENTQCWYVNDSPMTSEKTLNLISDTRKHTGHQIIDDEVELTSK